MKTKSVFLLGPALLLSSALFAQAPTMGQTAPQAPMTEKEVTTELKKEGAAQLQKDLGIRGVAFEMTPEIEKGLRKAKATDELIKAVTAAGPKERTTALAIASGGAVIPTEEADDWGALQRELDPDKAVALAEAYVQKHPQSPILSFVYAFEAQAYQTKGDAAKIVEFAEKSLKIKGDNLMSLQMVTYAIPTPQFIQMHQSDEEQQLSRAEAFDQDGFKVVEALRKQANETDADFAKRKATLNANFHSSLGMIHLDRAQLGLTGLDKDELAKAESEYKQAVSLTDKPEATDYYRLGDTYRLQLKIDDAIAAFTKASELSQGVLKQYADRQIDVLKKAKAQQAAAPAKP